MKNLPLPLIFNNPKKVIVTLIFLLVAIHAQSFTLMEQLFLSSNSNCGYPVVFISDSLYDNLDSVTVVINISSEDVNYNETLLYSSSVSLTDTNYFQYLGDLVFDPTDTSGSRLHAYRFIFNGYTPIDSTITLVELNLQYDGQDVRNFSSVTKSCIQCSAAPSRYLMLYQYSFLSFWLFDSYTFPDSVYENPYASLPFYAQQAIATALNWINNDTVPGVNDYLNMLNPAKVDQALVDSTFGSVNSNASVCGCQQDLLETITGISNYLATIGPGDDSDFENFSVSMQDYFAIRCYCLGTYYISLYSTSDSSTPPGFIFTSIPLQGGMPIINSLVIFDGGNVYTSIAFSYNAQNELGITYAGSGNFNYTNGFIPADTSHYDIPFSNVSIVASGAIRFCNGDSVILSISPQYPHIYWSNGDSAQILTVDTSGVFNVTVIDSEGCFAHSDTTAVITVFNNPVAHAGNDTTICFGTGIILGGTPAATGGDSIYTYSWFPSTGLNDSILANPIATPTATTTYILTVTDSNGCSGKDTIIVTINPLPVAHAGDDTSICSGSAVILGAIPVATGGDSTYTYAWSPSVGLNDSTLANPTATASLTTTYYLTLTDGNGCTANDSVKMTVNALPLVFAGDDTTICNGSSIVLGGTPTAGGNDTPYTYSWSPSSSLNDSTLANPSASPSQNTSYRLTVTDGNGCVAVDSIDINIDTVPINLSISVTSLAICASATGSATVSVDSITDPTGYSYLWSNGANTFAVDAFTAGIYYTTVTDAYGCAATDSVTIGSTSSDLSLTVSENNATCTSATGNGSAYASNDYGNWWMNGSDFSYLWSNGDTNYTADSLTASEYYVTVTDNFGCTATDSVTVGSTYSDLSISTDGQDATCTSATGHASVSNNDDIVGAFSPDYRILWSDGGTTQSIDSLFEGVYYVTVTDNFGCTATDSVTVGLTYSDLSISTAERDATCTSATGLASVSNNNDMMGAFPSDYRFLWSNDGTTESIDSLTAGKYYVTVTDNFGCAVTDSVTVGSTYSDLSISTGDRDATCTSATGLADVSDNNDITGFPSGYLFLWSNGGTTESIDSLIVGEYYVTVTDNFGCTATDSVTVGSTYSGLSISTDGQDATCISASGSASASASNNYDYSYENPSDFSFLWSNGDNSYNADSLIAGEYYLTVTDNYGCTATDSITVNSVNSSLPYNIYISAVNTTCNYPTGSATINILSEGPYNYQWSTGATTQGIEDLVPGTYKVTVSDQYGCTVVDSANVTGNPLPNANSGDDTTICNGFSVMLGGTPTASGGDSLYRYIYTWSPSAGLNDSTLANPIATPSVTTTYYLGVTDGNSCTATDSSVVTVIPLPTPSITPSDTFVLQGQRVKLTASGGTSYSWPDFGNSDSVITVIPENDSTYYTVIAFNVYGCTDTDSALITTIPFLGLQLYYVDTINSGDTTNIMVYSPDTGMHITWSRNDTSNVSGQTGGIGNTINIPLVNNTDSDQTVTFTVNGSDDGYEAEPATGGVVVHRRLGDERSIGLNVNTNFPGTVAACDTETYQLIITNSDTTNFTIKIALNYPPLNFNLSDSLFADSVDTVIGDTIYIYTKHAFTGADTLNYSFVIPCSVIPDSVVSSTNALQLYQTISVDSADGQSYSSYSVNGGGGFYLDSIPLNYPFIGNTLSSAITVSLSYQHEDTITVIYTNSGTAAFHGPIVLSDTLCSSVRIDTLILIVKDSAPKIYIRPTFPDTIPYISIPAGSLLTLKEIVSDTGCISSCSTNFGLIWGCNIHELCGNINQTVNVQRSSEEPLLTIARIFPVPAPGNPFEYAWDAACNNSTTQWEYLIENRSPIGGLPAFNTVIDLKIEQVQNTYTYIIDSSVHLYSADITRFPNTIPDTSLGDTISVPIDSGSFANSLPTACFVELEDSGQIPIQEFLDTLPILLPGQKIILQFQTFRCCARDNAFNNPINYNLWNLAVSCTNECGTLKTANNDAVDSTYVGIGVTTPTYKAFDSTSAADPNAISSDEYDSYPNLALIQYFQQNITDIEGGPDGTCGTIDTFNITNIDFTSTNDLVSDYGTQIFTNGGSGETGLNAYGQFKMQIVPQQGLLIPPNDTPVIISAGYVWNPISWSAATGTAIFNIDTISLPVGVVQTSNAFRNFFINSNFEFFLQGCCTTPFNPSPQATVYTYFNPQILGANCDSCFIPLSSVSFGLELLCPGCNTPGIIVKSFNLTRNNFGFQEADNFGLPDGPPLMPIDSSYQPLIDGELSLDHAIVGDTLIGITTAFFENGATDTSGIGYSYSQWQAYWGSHTWTGSPGTPALSNLYMQQTINGSDALGIHCIKAQITYIPLATGTPVIDSIPVGSIIDTDNTFLFYITDTALGVVFQPQDSFVLTALYKICNNPPNQLSGDTTNPADTLIKLNTSTEMFLTSAPVGVWDPYQTYPVATAVDTDTTDGTGPAALSPDSIALYMCQGLESSSGITYVYPIMKYFNLAVSNNKSCSDTATLNFTYYVYSPDPDPKVFPYEYRLLPGINPDSTENGPSLNGVPIGFFLNLTHDFRAEITSTYTSCYSYLDEEQHAELISGVVQNDTPAIPYLLDTNSVMPGPYDFMAYVNTDSIIYSPPFEDYFSSLDYNPSYNNVPSNIDGYPVQSVNGGRVLLLGDAYFNQTMYFIISPRCDAASQIQDTIAVDSIYVAFPDFDIASSCSSPVADTLRSTSSYFLTIPQDTTISATIDSGPILNGSYVRWQLSFVNPEGVTVSNMILFVSKQLADSLGIDSVTVNSPCTGTNLVNIDTTVYTNASSDSFYRYTLGGSQPFCIAIKLQQCLDSIQIPFYFSWNCDGLPDTLPPVKNLCSKPDSIILHYTLDSIFYHALTPAPPALPYNTCSSITLTACVTNPEPGGIGNFVESLQLPSVISVDISSVNVTVMSATDTTNTIVSNISSFPDTLTDSTLWVFNTQQLTLLNSDSSILGFDGLNTNHPEMCVSFNILPKCNSPEIKPSIQFIGTKFCGGMDTATDYFDTMTFTNGCGPYAYLIDSFAPCRGPISDSISPGPDGVAPLTETWDSMPSNFTNPLPGFYKLKVTDSNGCYGVDSVTIDVPIYANGYATNKSCPHSTDGSVIIDTTSGGIPPYDYVWSFNNERGPSITDLNPGTYYLTIYDKERCTFTDSFTVHLLDSIDVTLASTDTIKCYGEYVTIVSTDSFNIGNVYYNWSNGDTTSTIYVISGTYTLTVTDSVSCTNSASIEILPSKIVITDTVINANLACFGDSNGEIMDSVTGGTGPYTYDWSNGAITKNVTGLVAGLYILTVTDANLCTATDSVTITQPAAALKDTIIGTNVSCYGEANGIADLTVTGGTTAYSYSWSNDDTTQNITGLVPGTYTVIVTDAHTCTTTASISITQPVAALAATIAGTNLKCYKDSIGGDTLTVSGGTTPYSYHWSNGKTTENIGHLGAAIYSVTITDHNACSITKTDTITQPAILAVELVATDYYCFGQRGSYAYYITGGTAPYYTIYEGDTVKIEVPASDTIYNESSGEAYMYVSDANGCAASDTATIRQLDSLSVDSIIFLQEVSCYGGSNGEAVAIVFSNIAPYRLIWTYGYLGDTLATTSDTLTNGNSYVEYYVYAVDSNGCSDFISFYFTQPDSPLTAQTAIDSILCYGNSGKAIVTASGGTPSYMYFWNSTPPQNGDTATLTAGSFTAVITDSNSCTDTIRITLNQPSALTDTLTSDSIYCNGEGIVAATASGGVPPYIYYWSNSDTGNVLSNVDSGTYYVTITDANRCTLKDTAIIVRESVTNPYGDTIASGDTIWTSPHELGGNLVIEPGAVLILDSTTLQMCDTCKIIVEQGATLVIDTSTITSLCDSFWPGIEVWGTASSPQGKFYFVSLPYSFATPDTNQGYIYIVNGSTIENANRAVLLAKTNLNGTVDPTTTGGEIEAEASYFINNNSDIVFYPYLGDAFFDSIFVSGLIDAAPGPWCYPCGVFVPTDTIGGLTQHPSFIDHCHFITTANYPTDFSTYAPYHIWMDDVHGIPITNCVFDNQIYADDSALINSGSSYLGEQSKIGYGILTYDADFGAKQDTFKGLWMGINSNGTGKATPLVLIDSNQFINTANAINLNSLTIFSVLQNTITSDSFFAQGIYDQGCTNFRMEENTVHMKASNGNYPHAGIYNVSTSDAPNEVYKNTITSNGGTIMYGIANSYNNNGLFIHCNTFDTLMDNILVLSGGIAPQQGICATTDTGGADNTLTTDCSAITDAQIFVNPGTEPFIYYFDPSYAPNPGCINDTLLVTLSECPPGGGGSGNACPSRIEGITGGTGCGRLCLQSSIDSLTLAVNHQYAYLDNGKTSVYLEMINADADTVIFDSLRNVNGMLSDDVLLKTITYVSGVGYDGGYRLNDSARLAGLLIQNSPLSSPVISEIKRLPFALPADSITKLNQYQDSTSRRQPIIDTIYELKNQKHTNYMQLASMALTDSTYQVKDLMDSLRSESDPYLQMMLADLYTAGGKYDSMESVISNLQVLTVELYELQQLRFDELYFYQNGWSWFDMANSTSEAYADGFQYTFETIASADRSIAAIQAQVILHLVFGDSIMRIFEFKQFSNSGGGGGEGILDYTPPTVQPSAASTSNSITKFAVYPNPASNQLTIEYHFDSTGIEENEFVLYDLLGDRVLVQTLNSFSGKLNLDVSGITNGIYLYNFQQQKANVNNGKVTILK